MPAAGRWFDTGTSPSAPALTVTSARGSFITGRPPIADLSGSGTLAPGVVAWAESVVEALRLEDRFPSASVLVHDPATAGLRLAAHRAGADDAAESVPAPQVVPLTGSVSGWVFRMGRPTLVADVTTHPDYQPFAGSATRSELAAPILHEGRPIGVLDVESPRPGEFGIDDLERLERRAAAAARTLPVDELPAA
ncbi:MAG TPA: GAF domain-containing protein [Candidatus Limnocylindrales bacterium]|nr:GAF domain-containing protein [Candidatus Limnocylindrales bacterium]